MLRLLARGHLLIDEEEVPIDRLPSDHELAPAVGAWEAARAGRAMPTFDALDPDAPPPALADAATVELDWSDGLDMRLVSLDADLDGIADAGDIEAMRPAQLRILLKRHLLEVAFGGRPTLRRIEVRLGASRWAHERLMLPVETDEPGRPGLVISKGTDDAEGRRSLREAFADAGILVPRPH